MIKLHNLAVFALTCAATCVAAQAWANGGSGTQRPSGYSGGGYGAYYSPSGQYVSLNTGGSTSSPHRSSWYAYQNVVNRRPINVQAPCGLYMRQPVSCHNQTLSYNQYEKMNR